MAPSVGSDGLARNDAVSLQCDGDDVSLQCSSIRNFPDKADKEEDA